VAAGNDEGGGCVLVFVAADNDAGTSMGGVRSRNDEWDADDVATAATVAVVVVADVLVLAATEAPAIPPVALLLAGVTFPVVTSGFAASNGNFVRVTSFATKSAHRSPKLRPSPPPSLVVPPSPTISLLLESPDRAADPAAFSA
jgi:hypothetical protein